MKDVSEDLDEVEQTRRNVDRQAEFVSLLAQNYRALYSYAVSLGADLTVADDIMQESSLVLWQQFDRYESGSNFVHWGRVVVRNVYRNHRRSFAHRRYVFSPQLIDKLFETHCVAEELFDVRRTALQQCLKKLSGSELDLVNSFYQEGSSLTAAAQHSGKTPNSLHKAISRIRLKLSRCIDQRMGVDDGSH
ncbi:sigma-70 family RNA polymerase sigma factor [Planctomicrobium sp. SH661]|uniref:sigma-70 family RNA polymerase sigma factor n=1 Tax=Planctomicrobium sp. SH661 TaxID=3448124 RepID=UPI003F5CB43A